MKKLFLLLLLHGCALGPRRSLILDHPTVKAYLVFSEDDCVRKDLGRIRYGTWRHKESGTPDRICVIDYKYLAHEFCHYLHGPASEKFCFQW